MGHELPARPAVLGHIDGLALDELALHVHLVQHSLLEVVLRLDHILLNRGVLQELLPDLLGGERPALVEEARYP